MDDFEDFYIDEEEVEKAQQEREAKQKERQQRVMGGADSRVVGVGDDDGEQKEGGEAGGEEELSLEQREERWGFKLEELKAATKVVNVLFNNPQLYVGDPYLAESRMYTMVSRDRKTKRDNKETFKKIQNEEKRLRDRSKREADVATIKKTMMKKERDAALTALMLEGPAEGSPLLLEGRRDDNDEDGGNNNKEAQTAKKNVEEENAEAAAHIVSDFKTCFKIHKFLEREFARRGGAVKDPNAQHINDEHLYDASEKFMDADVNWSRVSTAVSKYFRVYPHTFDTAMPTPIHSCELLYRKMGDLLGAQGVIIAEEKKTSAADGDVEEAAKLQAQAKRYAASNILRLRDGGGGEAVNLLEGQALGKVFAEWRASLPDVSPEDDDDAAAAALPTTLPWTLRDLDAIRRSQSAFNAAVVDEATSALPFDWRKLPFGKLSMAGLAMTASTLREVREELTRSKNDGDDSKKKETLLRLSNEYFTRMPHNPSAIAPILTEGALALREQQLSALCDLLILAVVCPNNNNNSDGKKEDEDDLLLSTRTTPEDMEFLSAGQPDSNTMFDTTEASSGSAGGGRNKTRKRPPGASAGGAAGDKKNVDTTTSLRATDAADFVLNELDEDGNVAATVSYALFDNKDVFRIDVFGALSRGGAIVASSPTSGNNDNDDDAAAAAAAFVMNRLQKCHTCKIKYRELHGFYYSLCPPCGEFNYDKRMMTRDLRGKVVVLTGARIKIGYAMALSLLRCGATLIGTTRFAHDAVARFMEEGDYDSWKDRLHLYSLDLRDMWMVTQFCAFIGKNFPKIFAIINNAAQTIARTAEYTADLRNQEVAPAPKLIAELKEQGEGKSNEWWRFFNTNCSVTVGESLHLEHHPDEHAKPFVHPEEGGAQQQQQLGDGSATAQATERHVDPTASAPAAALSKQQPEGQIISTLKPASEGFIYDRYDTQAEESDRRTTNTWTMNMGEVQGSEAAEVMAINALSPFVINAKLKPFLMNRDGDASPNEKRFIINVSAMEGQFYRFKQTTHPHTNMAKAALNMMTRTSASDYVKDGIFMNSVDTGWITDESPMQKKQRRSEEFMLCPLDEVDAAARCLDLIYMDSTEHGKFYKDFHTIAW